MLKKKLFMIRVYFFLFLYFLSLCSLAQTYRVQDGTIIFYASTPLHDYEGESKELQGSVDFTSGEVDFKVPVKSFKTGIGKRDRDMYELLKAEKYPYIHFKAKVTKNINLKTNKEQKAVATGEMEISGVSNELEVPGTLIPEGDNLRLKATFDIYITNYNIEPPSFLFNTVRDRHRIEVNAILTPSD